MKTFFELNRAKPFSFLLIFFMAIALSFTACKKDSTANLSAYVMVTNSAEGSAAQDFYLDNNMVGASAVAYTQSSSYITTSNGSHTGQFKATGTTNVDATINLTLASGSFYTVFYTSGNNAVVGMDDRTAPSPGKARVRFINLSSALASNIDVTASGSLNLITGLAFKVFSTYNDVDVASSFSLMASGSSTVLLNIPATLQAGHIYTIYFSGTSNASLAAPVIEED